MNIAAALSVQTAKYYWKQTVKMVLLYCLCAVFIVIEGCLLFSFLRCSREEKDNTFGVQSALAFCVAQENALALGQLPEVENMGIISVAALLIALGASLGICLVINKIIPGFTLDFIPTRELVAAVLLYFAAAVGACWLPVRAFFRRSIVECVEGQN
ncbi:MAG: hypothetical protein LBC83_07065 [Oscillospiraceae bacterium]|jgi:ABC-type phosphate transport system permease subunit|nr:hypothetical protein [Oscillospiraceae bacterium]